MKQKTKKQSETKIVAKRKKNLFRYYSQGRYLGHTIENTTDAINVVKKWMAGYAKDFDGNNVEITAMRVVATVSRK